MSKCGYGEAVICIEEMESAASWTWNTSCPKGRVGLRSMFLVLGLMALAAFFWTECFSR